MSILLLLTIFTAAAAVSFPARIKQIGLQKTPTNDYMVAGPSTITYLQDITADQGMTLTYNLTSGDGQLVASDGPKLTCHQDASKQFGSLVNVLRTSVNPGESCPHPKGERKINREFDTVLVFDDMPAPSCGSNFILDVAVNVPERPTPIHEASFYIFPKCNDDNGSN